MEQRQRYRQSGWAPPNRTNGTTIPRPTNSVKALNAAMTVNHLGCLSPWPLQPPNKMSISQDKDNTLSGRVTVERITKQHPKPQIGQVTLASYQSANMPQGLQISHINIETCSKIRMQNFSICVHNNCCASTPDKFIICCGRHVHAWPGRAASGLSQTASASLPNAYHIQSCDS